MEQKTDTRYMVGDGRTTGALSSVSEEINRFGKAQERSVRSQNSMVYGLACLDRCICSLRYNRSSQRCREDDLPPGKRWPIDRHKQMRFAREQALRVKLWPA